MKYFTRCKVLHKVLTAICVILGIVLIFDCQTLTENIKPFNIDLHFCIYMILLSVFIFLLITVFVLGIIIKDAEEDYNSVINYLGKKDSDNNKL